MMLMISAQLVILVLTVAILMWDNGRAQQSQPVRVRVKSNPSKQSSHRV